MGDLANLAVLGAVAKATLDHLEHAAVVCDETGEVVVGNDAARELFERRDGLALREGRIYITAAGPRERLQALLAGEPAGGGAAGSPPLRTAALLVTRPSRLPAYQIVLREIDQRSIAFAHNPQRLWSLIISDPARAPGAALRALSSLYRLTPAEERIASALVAGDTPDEIATSFGVKITTIRSQLASIYAKTSTRRQSELVRLVSSVPALR